MIRTLIADDDALLRAALRTMVDWEALGYTLVWDCTNGLQVLELLQRTTVDLLITDMKMPLLDGLGLIRRLRQSALLPVTVVLSGYDEYELVREAFRLGAHDYLLKGNLDTASLTAMLTELRRRIFADGGTAAGHCCLTVQWELTLQINIYNLVGNPAKNGIFAIRSVLNRYTKSILMPEQWRSKQTHLRPMQEIILRQKRLERL